MMILVTLEPIFSSASTISMMAGCGHSWVEAMVVTVSMTWFRPHQVVLSSHSRSKRQECMEIIPLLPLADRTVVSGTMRLISMETVCSMVSTIVQECPMQTKRTLNQTCLVMSAMMTMTTMALPTILTPASKAKSVGQAVLQPIMIATDAEMQTRILTMTTIPSTTTSTHARRVQLDGFQRLKPMLKEMDVRTSIQMRMALSINATTAQARQTLDKKTLMVIPLAMRAIWMRMAMVSSTSKMVAHVTLLFGIQQK